MSDDDILRLADVVVDDDVLELSHNLAVVARLLDEIRRLRARVAELEAAGAVQRGTLQMQTMQTTDGGIRFTWNVPPSTPPVEIP
jgi:hypothetical protein